MINKLFNKKLLKQNFKKSKSLMALLVVVFPLLDFLFMWLSGGFDSIDNGIRNILNINEINERFEIIGFIFIPIILSVILFGYTYNKKKVDLINSMPVSRKSYFVTNWFGGIIVIFMIQILFTLATIISIILSDSSVLSFFLPKILTNLLLFFVAYCFIFTAEVLASTIVGNFLSEVVMTYALVGFVPLFLFSIMAILERPNNFILKCFPIPVNFEGSVYEKIFVTLIYTVIFVILGYKFFQKKQMEYSGTSFKTEKGHFILKDIVLLIPYIFFLRSINYMNSYFELSSSLVIFLIFVTISFTFYIIADLILNKKIKFKKNLINYFVFLIVIAIIMMPVFLLSNPKYNDYLGKDIDRDDIEAVSICEAHYGYYDYNIFNMNDDNSAIYFDIKDPNYIDTIYDYYKKEWDYSDETIVISFKLKNGIRETEDIPVTKSQKNRLYRFAEKTDEFKEFKESLKIKENENYIGELILDSGNNIVTGGFYYNTKKLDSSEIKEIISKANQYIDNCNTIKDLQKYIYEMTDRTLNSVTIYMYKNGSIVSQNYELEFFNNN